MPEGRPVVAVQVEETDLPLWRSIFAERFRDARVVRLDEAVERPEEDPVLAAVVWKPPRGALHALPGLRFVLSRGAGADGLLADEGVPDTAEILRLIDPAIASKMAEFVTLSVLHLHRDWISLRRAQGDRQWLPERGSRPARERSVGLMGLGVLGRAAAERLAPFGFELLGWSRTARSLPGVETFSGRDALQAFVRRSDILVCLLPLTNETRGLVDAAFLGAARPGTLFVNAGRGEHVVEADLLDALDTGRIAGAVLDVTREEPLPPEHRFWTHPNVLLTQHGAAVLTPEEEARAAARILKGALAGVDPPERVVRDRGY
ncbi:hypothetical protein ASG43_11520 [Aureimonas sp. Leaf454]|uniref:2-hydroxyacid dehydrogenase n=1 Tax=Aureimonas sp. Leaf454 TaxID=1736381 RepID=UPI0006FD0757|nr:glyoxylate/hydroxypyruvate reductase A [Aureimonas sp. Leaf454]KQT46252.1 hypothetical protein ASG43_11520 [Aureimonas sp. Leaf454]